MAGRVTFTANPLFESEFEQDPDTRQVLTSFAERGLEGVRAAAGAAGLPPHYVDSWSIAEGETGPELVTTDSLWAIFEFGAEQSPPYAPIRQGVESAGFDMTDPHA